MTGPLSWWRLELAVPEQLEESLLWRLDSLGIPRVALRHRPESPQARTLLAWLPAIDWPESQRRELVRALEPLGEPFGISIPPIHWFEQSDEDWSSSWKQHWQPDPVGQRLLILPAWLECPEEHADRLVIVIDPGSAFGTGSHPTTRLCLEAMESLPLSGWRVADLGCGSGILGLGALSLGAAAVAAVDTDSMAKLATGTNRDLNHLEHDRLRVDQGSAERLVELLDSRPADLLLCNILAPVIEALCPSFSALLAPAGIGLLSGLLVDQAPPLQAALAAQGWHSDLTACQGRWGLLTIQRQGVVA